MMDVRGRLSAPDLAERLDRLGFAPEDHADLLAAVKAVLDDDGDLAAITTLTSRLLPIIGVLHGREGDPFDGPEGRSKRHGQGVLAMLALVVTVDEVQDFHRRRGISDELSWRALSDLGQQVRVHRLTFGGFGIHTQGWLCVAWSGALYWLGRLQFNLHRQAAGVGEFGAATESDTWALSTHIPRTGALTPESVDDSFTQAGAFFAEHFSDFPVTTFHCDSWLLDPELAAALSSESNMARFQHRWRLYGEGRTADADALFFTFAVRGAVDLDTLPQDTTLQRAIVARLRDGGHWCVWEGRAPLPAAKEL